MVLMGGVLLGTREMNHECQRRVSFWETIGHVDIIEVGTVLVSGNRSFQELVFAINK